MVIKPERVYKMSTNDHTFDMVVIDYSETHLLIKVGKPVDRSGPCIEIMVHKDGDKVELLMVKYDEHYTALNSTKQMTRGHSTQVMLKTTLQLLFDTYPRLKRVSFRDASEIETDQGYISLIHHNMFMYKESWYARRFSAKPYNKEQVAHWLSILSQSPKTTMTFREFWNNILPATFTLKNTHLNNDLKNCFKQSKSWPEFMRSIHTIENIIAGQTLPLLINALKLPSLVYSKWYIKRTSFGMIYTIETRTKDISMYMRTKRTRRGGATRRMIIDIESI